MRAGVLSLPLLLLITAGCASGGLEEGDGDDAGGTFDAGPLPPPPLDVGPREDAGTDGGPRPDLGPGADSGPRPDDGGPPPPPRDSGPGDPCATLDCSSLDGDCAFGACVGGRCVAMPRDVGTPCNDFDPCTTGEVCMGDTTCSPGTPIDCSAMTGDCGVGTCDPRTGGCFVMPENEGMSCDGPAMECGSWACRAGVCSAVAAPDGTACSGAAAECARWSCLTGSCTRLSSADCTSCSTGFCAAGSCSASPTSLSYGFEAGLPAGWTTSGDAPWRAAMGASHGGAFRAESGDIGNGERSSLSMTINLASSAQLSFWLSTSTESGYDLLELWIDGTRVGQWSGTTSTQASFVLSPGARSIEWRYTKDASSASGDDQVWIDDVTIGPAPPLEGFEGGSFPAGWATSGSTPWTVVSSGARTGTRAAASGDISSGQTSSLTRTVTLATAGSVRFAYRVSSELDYDFLSFWIDGTRQAQWSGTDTTGWTLVTYPLAAGTHTLEWRYTKDGSFDRGEDRGLIDDVEVGDPPAAVPLCG